jgi:hypothetical protein
MRRKDKVKPIPRDDVRMIIYTSECWSVIIKRTMVRLNQVIEEEDFKQELVIAGIEAYHKWMDTPGNSRENMNTYTKGRKTLLSYIIRAMKYRAGRIIYLSDMDKRKLNFENKYYYTDSDPREDLNEEFYNEPYLVRKGEVDDGYDSTEIDEAIDRLPVSSKDQEILKAIIRESPESFNGAPISGVSIKDLSYSTGYSPEVISEALNNLAGKSEVRELIAS